MRIWKDSATIEEKPKKTSIAGKKRGRFQRARKKQGGMRWLKLGKFARTRSTRNEHVGRHRTKKSDVIGFVRKSEDMEGFDNNCGKTQKNFHRR